MQIAGEITHLFYASPDFSAGKIRIESGDVSGLWSFSGKFMAAIGDFLTLEGETKRHPKYGKQFEATACKRNLQLDRAGLAKYLENSQEFSNIGPVRARKIAAAFGDDFNNVIASECGAAKIAKASGLQMEDAENLVRVWRRLALENEVQTQLAAWGVTANQARKLIDRFGDSAPTVVKNDPYKIIGVLRGWGFKRVDEIARRAGIERDDPSRVSAGILHVIKDCLESGGHTWVSREALTKIALDLLMLDRDGARKIVDAGILELELADEIIVNIGSANQEIGLKKVHNEESFLYDCLKSMQRLGDSPHVFDLLETIGRVNGGEIGESLNDDQRAAVVSALSFQSTTITGGAGTGKTYVIKTLVECIEAAGLNVALCAPTGKAARRMADVVGVEAKTIHRMLGYNGHTFAQNADDKISGLDYLIIDEMSMVDSSLAYALFQALNIDRVAVVFVGDHNQLPPVGYGNLLRDIIEHRLTPVVRLERVMRQAGALKENCNAILGGVVAPTIKADGYNFSPWRVVNNLRETSDVEAFIHGMYETVLSEKLGFDLVRDVQLLTPRRTGPLSVDELNKTLQKIVQAKVYGVDIYGQAGKFFVGDKIIQRRNNYELDVMNGTIGYVASVENGGTVLTVDFDGVGEKKLTAENEQLKDIQLAYALTIHQTQGSEFPCAFVICHKQHAFMLNRNLLYTGVTRARRSAIVAGDSWGVRAAAEKVGSYERRTWFAIFAEEKS